VNTVHQHRPVTLPVAKTGGGWLLAAAAICFAVLAVGASVDALPWDGPISRAVIDARTPLWNTVALRVSSIGRRPKRADAFPDDAPKCVTSSPRQSRRPDHAFDGTLS